MVGNDHTREKDVGVTEPTRESAERRPAGRFSQLIEFERAEVITPMIYPPQPRLVVTGQKPWANMEVTLRPLIYIRQPEYWGIEVIGTMPQIGQPAIVPYAVELDLAGTIGTAGVEVIGANCTERIDVATS
jgi:hypothetical protein